MVLEPDMKKTITTLVVAGAVGSAAILAGAYSGLINVGADDPHYPAVHAFLSMARDRSIEARSKDIEIPNLDDEALSSVCSTPGARWHPTHMAL